MKPRSSHFTVPLTFSSRPSQVGGHSGSVGEREWVDISCSTTQPAILQSWGSWSAADSGNESESNSRGAIIGSQDGTLYLFHQSTSVNTGQQHQREISQNSRPTSPPYLSRDSPTTPRSNSPCSSAAPFNVTSRSRIVSGITAEQVEAPKNYVDFDDEPEKLKDMLKGKNPRDRPASLELNLEKGVSRGLSAEPALRRRADPKSLLSATNSPAFTPKSSSAPASPRPRVTISPQGTNDLTLYCHIIPPRSGEKSSVTAIRLLEDNQSFVVLRETG
ncbi:hypothetical protein BD779DRAFT_1593227 [Infundibulicybe gibba]|nr:hypothetical protein BD779DRAFT_1593227 [Infundibulicybe gibba]